MMKCKYLCLLAVLTVALIAVGFVGLRAQDAGGVPPAKSADGITDLPGIKVNTIQREFYIGGNIRQNRGPIELVACAPGSDKVHEVIVQLDCNPIDFNLALIMINLKNGTPVHRDDTGKWQLPSGPKVIAYLEWDGPDGEKVKHRLEDLIFNVKTNKSMRRNGWVFTGSSFVKDKNTNRTVFLANEVKTLIATYHDQTTILDNPSITGQDDTFFEANHKLLPAMGTSIRFIVALPTTADEKQWAAWAKSGDDESDLFVSPEDKGKPVKILQKWSGLHSDYAESFFTPTKTQKQFETLWQRLHSQQSEVPALPVVDFKKDMLVALLCGKKATAGYATEARKVVKLGGSYVVYWEDIVPAAGVEVAQMETSAWQLIRIPRNNLPVKFKSFQELEPATHSIIEGWQGESSSMEAGSIIVKDLAAWSDLWRLVFSKQDRMPPVPQIDFDKHMILGVVGQATIAAGEKLTVTELNKAADGLHVIYTVTEATEKTEVAAYLPFHVLVTENTEQAIHFEER